MKKILEDAISGNSSIGASTKQALNTLIGPLN